jgi:dTDP-4-dehydrorhamnose reductase
MKIKTIITGSTGMVGEGVLHECLLSPEVESVLVINRRPCNIQHPKLKEIIHKDFYDFTAIKSELTGYNACFHCMGVTSVGKNEAEYSKLTYDITMALAGQLANVNKGMTFCYVSGSGTDATEKGKIMWARVKGKTENHLIKLFTPKAYMFRPALIIPTPGLKNTYKMYKVMAPLIPVFKFLMPKYVCSLKEIGLAMINTVNKGCEQTFLEVPYIIRLAQK